MFIKWILGLITILVGFAVYMKGLSILHKKNHKSKVMYIGMFMVAVGTLIVMIMNVLMQ